MNTSSESAVDVGRRRRKHSDEFKANLVALCLQPGMSMAAVALAHGVNANLLWRWVHEAQLRSSAQPSQAALSATKPVARSEPAAFLAMALPAPLPTSSATPDIRIELRRGTTSVTLTWPTQGASECAAWMRELLR